MTRQLVWLGDVPNERPWATVRMLRRLVAEHRVAFHRIGNRIYFDLDDLDDYAETGRVEPSVRLNSRAAS